MLGVIFRSRWRVRNPVREDDALVLVVLDFGNLVMQNIYIIYCTNDESNNCLFLSLST